MISNVGFLVYATQRNLVTIPSKGLRRKPRVLKKSWCRFGV